MDISRHENFYIEMLPWMSTIVNEKERGRGPIMPTIRAVLASC
jgi:hypothetical protein